MKNRGPGTDISTGRAKVVRPQAGPSNLALNLRRLVFFHHPTAKDAAGVIGVSEHAMSAWLTDKRKPGRDSLLRVAAIYDFDPRLLSGDPLAFARELADPGRISNAEENILHRDTVGAVTPLRRAGETQKEA
jgi:transcriptional regulator with XRE-family HTH domain